MKLKRAMMIMLSGVLIFLMSGCGSSKDPKPVSKSEKVKEAVITFEFSKEKQPTAVNSMYEDSAQLVNVVVKTDQKITNVKFMNAEFANSDQEIAEFYVNSTGYEQKELTPDQTLVYATEFPDSTPSNLMSYTDTTGDEKIMYISMSGKDESVVSAEASIIERPKEPEEPKEPKDPEKQKGQTNVESPEATKKSANVSIYYVSDDELNSLSDYDAIIDPAFDSEEDRPYLRNVIFRTDAPITGFKILDCEPGKNTNDSMEMIVHGVAYDYGNVDGNAPLIIQTTFPGSASVRGISYIDATGEEKAFILSESGNDGSLVVSPATIQR